MLSTVSRILEIVRRFDKCGSCLPQGENVLVCWSWSSYTGQRVGGALDRNWPTSTYSPWRWQLKYLSKRWTTSKFRRGLYPKAYIICLLINSAFTCIWNGAQSCHLFKTAAVSVFLSLVFMFCDTLIYYVMYNICIVKSKSKAVPLHAMEALGGRGGIAPAPTPTHSRPRH
jgi:hypothetical protein